jgi:site-specific recombinase XerD
MSTICIDEERILSNQIGGTIVVKTNIHALETKACTVFNELGYSKHTVSSMLSVARKLIFLHNEQGEEQLSVKITADYISLQEVRYENGEIARDTFTMCRNAVEYLTQIYNTGAIINKRCKLLPTLPDFFENLLSDILTNEGRNPKFNKNLYEHASTFFRWLCSKGHNDLSCVDEQVIREYLTHCSKIMIASSLNNRRRALKELLLFISEDGLLPESMSRLFLFSIPTDKKIKPLMPQDEIAAVLNAIDRSTVRGKRDYAIILLAAVTGMRGIDIVELTLGSVYWNIGEMRIVQEKTRKALALPLTTDVGKAMREYILNARPHSKSDKVFLGSLAPFGEMSRATLNTNLKSYCVKAGLPIQRNFHSLRRSIATNMVISGVSIITVAQSLGHSTINSTKQYISLNSRNLKECALDFNGIEISGGKL